MSDQVEQTDPFQRRLFPKDETTIHPLSEIKTLIGFNDQIGTDRFGNRYFFSDDTAFFDEGEKQTAGILITPQGRELIRRYPGFFRRLKRIIAKARNMEMSTFKTEIQPKRNVEMLIFNKETMLPFKEETQPNYTLTIDDGWKIEFLGDGSQSNVYKITAPDGSRFVLKIRKRDENDFGIDISYPYFLQTILEQLVFEKIPPESKDKIRFPTTYLATSEIILQEYIEESGKEEGESSTTEEQKDSLIRLFNFLKAMSDELVALKRSFKTFSGFYPDVLIPPLNLRTPNLKLRPDGTIVIIDPFYRIGVNERRNPFEEDFDSGNFSSLLAKLIAQLSVFSGVIF